MVRNWAFVIGINKYLRLRSLNYAVRDAELIRDFFWQEAGFEHVFYFSDNSPDLIAPDGSVQSTQPTYANLWSFLLDFFESPAMAEGDNFWFFFSGHGIRYQDRDYLMPCDGNPRAIEATAISLTYVTERLRRCGADNVILFLDACRNEGDKAGLGVGLEKHQGVITIYSCSPREKSWEISELQQGSFTYTLLEALRIQGEGNCATVERLYNYLRYRVPLLNRQYGYEEQTPYPIVEPAPKYHLILLPKYATGADIAILKNDAFKAEAEGNYQLAKQLWIRVNIAASGADMDAIDAFSRIAQRQGQSTVKVQPASVANKSGDKSQTSSKTSLQVFEFDVVTVNKKGQETNRRRQQAEYFTENLGKGIILEMVAIPGGTFLMGSPETEEGHSDDESPQHHVTVKPFFMGKYPITQAQWQAVAALPQVNRTLEPDPSRFKGNHRPVEKISWYDAIEFCERLSRLTQRAYRLPSEAEWEYACRAGTKTPFHFGETITPDLANYNGNYTYADASKGKYREETTPVGSFQIANAFGLYDMHGSVWEWCEDHWHDNYEVAPSEGSAWLSENDNQPRLLRGGSWYYPPWYCRCADRSWRNAPVSRNCLIGFRVVCAAAWTL